MSIKNENIQLLSPLDSFDANYDMMYYMWELNGYVKKIKEDNDYIDALLYEISNEEKKFEDKKEKVTYEKENILRIKMMKIIYYFNELVEYVLDNNLLNYKPGIVKEEKDVYNIVLIKMYVLNDIHFMEYLLKQEFVVFFPAKDEEIGIYSLNKFNEWKDNVNKVIEIIEENRSDIIEEFYADLFNHVNSEGFFDDTENIYKLIKLMKVCYIKYLDLKVYTVEDQEDYDGERFFGYNMNIMEYPELYALYYENIDYCYIEDHWLKKPVQECLKLRRTDGNYLKIEKEKKNLKITQAILKMKNNERKEIEIDHVDVIAIHFRIMEYMQIFYKDINKQTHDEDRKNKLHCLFIWYMEHLELRDDIEMPDEYTKNLDQNNNDLFFGLPKEKTFKFINDKYSEMKDEQVEHITRIEKFKYIEKNTEDDYVLKDHLEPSFKPFNEFLEEYHEEQTLKLYNGSCYNVAKYELQLYIEHSNGNNDNINIHYDIDYIKNFDDGPLFLESSDVCYNQSPEENLKQKIDFYRDMEKRKDTPKHEIKEENSNTCNNIIQNLMNISLLIYKFINGHNLEEEIISTNDDIMNMAEVMFIYKYLVQYYNSDLYNERFDINKSISEQIINARLDIENEASVDENGILTNDNVNVLDKRERFADHKNYVLGLLKLLKISFEGEFNGIKKEYITEVMLLYVFLQEKHHVTDEDEDFNINKNANESEDQYIKRKNNIYDIYNLYITEQFFYIFTESEIIISDGYYEQIIKNLYSRQIHKHYMELENNCNYRYDNKKNIYNQNNEEYELGKIEWNNHNYCYKLLYDFNQYKHMHFLMFYEELYNYEKHKIEGNDFDIFLKYDNYFSEICKINNINVYNEENCLLLFKTYREVMYSKFASYYVNNDILQKYTEEYARLITLYYRYEQIMKENFTDIRIREVRYAREIGNSFLGGKCKTCNKKMKKQKNEKTKK